MVSRVKVKGRWRWRPLALMAAALVVFGYVMKSFGLIPALVAMFFVAAAAGRQFKIFEIVMLAAFMSAFAVAVFVYGLGLPYTLFVAH
jgi:hypothetical protein